MIMKFSAGREAEITPPRAFSTEINCSRAVFLIALEAKSATTVVAGFL